MRNLSKVVDSGKSPIEKMVDKALDVKKKELRWPKKKLSPSMFPICSIQEYMKQVYQKVHNGVWEETGTMLNIFAACGTAMHEAVQNSLGHTGQFFGNWKCANKKCKIYPSTLPSGSGDDYHSGRLTRKRTTNNICPHCKQPMAYVEIKLNYKGLKGFVDGIIDNLDGTYSLLDLKSTMIKKAEDGTFFVQYHQYQIASYAYILKKQYGINIVDYTLVYVPRDNPKKFVSKTFKFDEAESKVASKFLHAQIDAWASVMEAVKHGSVRPAIAHKPCKNEKYYWDKFHTYDTCPFVDFCFIDRRLIARVEEIEQRIKADPSLIYTEVVRPRREKHQAGLQNRKAKQVRTVKQMVL